MGDLMTSETGPMVLAVFVLVLVIAVALYWMKKRHNRELTLREVIDDIAYERAQGMVIPNIDDGEIQIDQLLLTAHGLLIIDIKEVQGTVFGSDKMQDWTVINQDRRFTFSNPQPALYDRIAAVRHIVRQVPVAGRVLFLDGAEFTKGTPKMVASLEDLHAEFGEADKATAKFKIDAFRQHWETLQSRAVSGNK